MPLPRPQYFLLRVKRLGPLVPARWWVCDHDPADPDNKLDRGRLSAYPRAEIAGVECEPETVSDRAAWGAPHWKYAQPITEVEYRYQVARLRWAGKHQPTDPGLAPKRPVAADRLVLPNFERENSI